MVTCMHFDHPPGVVDFDCNPVAIERLLSFGRELQGLFSHLTSSTPSEHLKTLLQVSHHSPQMWSHVKPATG